MAQVCCAEVPGSTVTDFIGERGCPSVSPFLRDLGPLCRRDPSRLITGRFCYSDCEFRGSLDGIILTALNKPCRHSGPRSRKNGETWGTPTLEWKNGVVEISETSSGARPGPPARGNRICMDL